MTSVTVTSQTTLAELTTLSLLRFDGFIDRAWIFTQMGRMTGWPLANPLADIPGLRFGRLLGSGGGNGFSVAPNWGVYAWLAHWEDKSHAEAFFAKHQWWLDARERSAQNATFYLRPTMTHGEWGGDRPFTPNPDAYNPDGPVAVITRATIRTRKLLDFWRYVPKTSASIYNHPARLLSLGIGEYPIFMQATFSVWESGKAMTEFAYRSDHHKEAVKLTRERDWYKEEMFTRFQVDEMVGNWEGLANSRLAPF